MKKPFQKDKELWGFVIRVPKQTQPGEVWAQRGAEVA